jgi:hypothetical protein
MLKVSRILSLVLLLLLMAVPLTAGAQAAEPIAIGDTVEGTLTESNPQGIYEFEAAAGQTISITLMSEEFDAYLVLQVGDDNVIASDDDSAGSLNSRIGAFTIPEDGTYTIVATSYSSYYDSGATPGAYTLSLSEFETQSIEYTQTVDGELTDDELVAYYTFSGQEGDTVIIRLNSSDFDSYLRLSDAGGELMSNDDGGGNLNSLIGPYALPATGTYTIAASSLSESATGGYTLALERVELNMVAYGDEIEGELGKNTPSVYYSFEGASGDVVSIEVDSDADTNLTLNDPYNYQVAFDEDGGSGVNPEISEVSLNSEGIYTIVVQSPFGDTGPFTLTLARSELPSLDAGAQTLSFSTEQTQRSVVFTANAGEAVRLTMSVGDAEFSPSVDVLQNGSTITYISSNSISQLSVDFVTPEDGEVIVNISDYSYTALRMQVTLERLGSE